MSLKSIGESITTKFARQTFALKESSPTIMIGLGVVGVTATVILACRATLKMSDVLAEANEDVKEAEENNEGVDVQKSVFSAQLRTAIKIAKLYAPAVIIGVASVGVIAGSHVILQRRNAAMSAAYAGAITAYNKYRERVVADLGEGKDREYAYGAKEVEIVVEGPDGPVTEMAMVVEADNDGCSLYARTFEENNIKWSNYPGRNAETIMGMQIWANDLLNTRGHVFLNEVYDMLGFEPTTAGTRVGWVKNGSGDSQIIFGVWGSGYLEGKNWIARGGKDPIKLDFNVDGEIAHLLKRI